jgi:hypothetical protein
MAMDELSVVLKARELINKVGPIAIPVPIKPYAEQVGAVLHVDHDLAADEAGYAFEKNGKHHICINGKDDKRALPSSKYDDGRIGWRRLPIRGQDIR